MITIRDLVKDYDGSGIATAALRGVSFAIKKGEFVAIMGPSGSGKSTLLHILSFLDYPTSGSYHFADRPIDQFNDVERAHIRNKEMGFVFQSFNLLSHSSVYDNVEMPLLYGDVPAGERKQRVERAIASVGLAEKLEQETGKLSGGQKQRVAIARALVNEPNIIFADEPTGNLDSQSGAQVMDILAKLHKEGHTIILVTHETYTAAFAERLIHIRDGRLEKDERIARDKKEHNVFFK